MSPAEANKAMELQAEVRLKEDERHNAARFTGRIYEGVFIIVARKRIGTFMTDVLEIEAATITSKTGTLTVPIDHLEIVPPLPTAQGLGPRRPRKMRI
jgi:hypothetical protein